MDELSCWKEQFIPELEQLSCVLTDQVPGYKPRAGNAVAEVARETVVGAWRRCFGWASVHLDHLQC